jgi:ATP-binding cassette subfamily G (WHITE) protein 2 (PDR)
MMNEFGTISEPKMTSDATMEQQHDHAIVELARKFSGHAETLRHESPFKAAQGGRLDPKSDQFNAKDWAHAFYNLRYGSGGDEAQARVAGVAFKDLSVWGKGSPTDFQSTVGNNLLKLPALFGKGEQKIDILRNLDGLILPGEQLCVLGPPGYDICLKVFF